jgi:hypothetical protein
MAIKWQGVNQKAFAREGLGMAREKIRMIKKHSRRQN